MNKLPQIMESFLFSIEHARGLDNDTIKAYRINLKCFNKHMFNDSLETNIDDIKALKVDDILINWLMKLKKEGMKEKTLNQRISTLRSFYKYLIGQQMLSLDISKSIPLFPERDAVEKKPLTLEECWKVLNVAEEKLNESYTFENLRNYLIVNLLLGSGVRREELTLLDISNFDLENKQIILRYDQVKGKKKGRIIALPQSVIDVYNQYLTYRLPMNAKLSEDLHDALFISKKFNRISKEMTHVIIKRIAAECNLEISCHHFRHTYASVLANSEDVELFRVSKNLGHSNLDITSKIYVHQGKDNTGEVNPIFNKKEDKKTKPEITKSENSNIIQLKWA